ncbi:16S rRNA (guanine(966)-N(2))-methyltransferase RsmD [Magnetospira sp. QH-2]|uniref:16S rRNA (guanine(966)-N(2))-methyltransferase RsmD n=1 Tax=Magnetospira sp. (strain QH-2) TaxID=1288970 RepID=UPI0003E810FA|nr:16S rRNA (guanine(966)-N(2))-methyltransferase RsmD [Magnetospira sp. QH-2]CCQ74877.1 putative Ribosomal RNA small subunit methyltransferase D [Magnetospira sp. QH-2]
MRIIAGQYKGRTLQAPKGRDTRPTADRTRESLFNVLIHGVGLDFTNLSVVDLFAGSGGLGLEALSRGAGRITFVDFDRQALKCAQGNAASLGEAKRVLCLKLDATRLPPPPRAAEAPCGLAFLDAPYGQGLTQPALLGLAQRGWLAGDAVVVVEVGAEEPLMIGPGFEQLDDRTHGAARVVVLRRG